LFIIQIEDSTGDGINIISSKNVFQILLLVVINFDWLTIYIGTSMASWGEIADDKTASN